MGGIEVDFNSETRIRGLFAAGECASSGLHGANRLGSNSLAELVVLGRVAGEYAAQRALESTPINQTAIDSQAKDVIRRLEDLYNQEGNESGRKFVWKWVTPWKKVVAFIVQKRVCNKL